MQHSVAPLMSTRNQIKAQSKINYVCTGCTQNFTRKDTANRPNVRFHSGQASVVRLLEYLMGTTTGQYPTPDASDHPRYRSKSSHQEEYPSNRYFHDYSKNLAYSTNGYQKSLLLYDVHSLSSVI